MNKSIPDKWVRKAVYDAINDMVVDSETIPCYDSMVSEGPPPYAYTLLNSQTSDVDKANKCEWLWISTILIDCISIYPDPGSGSSLFIDNILESVRDLTDEIELDVSSGLSIVTRTMSFPTPPGGGYELVDNQAVFRRLMRLQLLIK
jgi:hypothetical protein